MPRQVAATAALLCLAALSPLGCGAQFPADGRPKPSPKGRPLGIARNALLDAAGGTVTSVDGRLTVTVPAGALTGPVNVTVDEITDTAPGRIDQIAYRLGPADTILAAPATFVFQAAAPGTNLGAYTVAYQENQGFWLRLKVVQRDPTAGTLTAASTHFGDWSIVTGSPEDFQGHITFQSTLGVPFSGTGITTLNHAGGDQSGTYYLQWGTLTLDTAQLTSGVSVCSANPVSVDLDANIAEVVTNPSRFRWGVTTRWPLTCNDSGGPSYANLASLFFDTMGIYRPDCVRSYSQGPVIAADHLQGAYKIDCGTEGAVTATWDMVSCTPGIPCLVCHNAVTSCDTGFSVCVDSGALPDGTACGAGNVCGAGACIAACVPSSVCTPAAPDPCKTYTMTCNATLTSGTCGASGNQPDGTSCSAGNVCSAGACIAACVPSSSCTPATPDPCKTYTMTCNAALTSGTCDPAGNQPDGTACGGGNVCSAGGCIAACVPSSSCTPATPDPCKTYTMTCNATLTSGTCDPTGLMPDGTPCNVSGTCTIGVCSVP